MTTNDENGDAPFDRVSLEERDGKLCVVFRAGTESAGSELALGVEEVDRLKERKASLNKEGLETPITDRALELIREAPDAP